jgi:hypothetical protein
MSIQNNSIMNTKISTQHKTKECPSCKKIFECKVETIQECDCAKVSLTQAQRNYIASNFSNCICVDCLKKIGSF